MEDRVGVEHGRGPGRGGSPVPPGPGQGAGDRQRLSEYLDAVRDIERRIQKAEEQSDRELPVVSQPVGIPALVSEHIKLMFDLQAVALAADVTRIFSFKLSRDVSNRVFGPSGSKTAFHTASHHDEKEDRIKDFQKINTYHVSMVPYFLEKLKNMPDGESNLLENTLVMYGSAMGNSNAHNHKRCPLFLVGRAAGLKGNLHLKAADGTPMANVMLALLQRLGLDDMEQFGDSTAAFDLTRAHESTTAQD